MPLSAGVHHKHNTCRVLQVGCREFAVLMMLLTASSPLQRLQLLSRFGGAMYATFAGEQAAQQ